ncbi:hypothetical protein evm_011915 [Chilo suppressalis]|nr:hypothetical protein evm_011915 [Chilo suppressalis]
MFTKRIHSQPVERVVEITSTQGFGDEATKYPQSYRDYVFHSLSEKGKEMFYAINIHPSCAEKNGECIKRVQCIEKKFLYISRVCYRRDLVCCYDDTVRNPVVGTNSYGSTTNSANNVGG